MSDEQLIPIVMPSLPEGATVREGFEFYRRADGTYDLDEDLAAIDLQNGYTIDCGAYGTEQIIRVQVRTQWDWRAGGEWESIICDGLEDAAATIVRLANRWLKMMPVDPRIIEGNKAEYEWPGPFSASS